MFQAAASPTVIERNKADITGIIWGIARANTTLGRAFNPSTSETIFINGNIEYPAAVAENAAPIDDTYARINARINIFEALLPSRVIEGATKPIIIKGTQKFMNCPEI